MTYRPRRMIDVHVFRRIVPAAQARRWVEHAWTRWHDMIRRPCSERLCSAIALLIEAAEMGADRCRVYGSSSTIEDVVAWCESVPGWWSDDGDPIWAYHDHDREEWEDE